jgi:ABC-2 type transport system ATP-binding protein/lipopolysaccharide transport system ATP-binding protein
LGFSIAINVNPDILLIDEVLAVGDAAFVPKCLDRIDDFRRRKKTILFVSHDLATVEKICDRVLWLKEGKIQMISDPKRAVDAYLQDIAESQEEVFKLRQEAVEQEVEEEKEEMGKPDDRREARWGKREVEITKVRMKSLEGKEKFVFSPDEGMVVEMDVQARSPIQDFVFGIGIFNSQNICCYGTNTQSEEFEPQSIEGKGKVICRIEKLNLINGTYYLDVATHKKDGYPYDYHRNLYSFMIASSHRDVGISRPEHNWSFSPGIKIKPPPRKP